MQGKKGTAKVRTHVSIEPEIIDYMKAYAALAGYNIQTLAGLISFSLDAFVEVTKENIPEIESTIKSLSNENKTPGRMLKSAVILRQAIDKERLDEKPMTDEAKADIKDRIKKMTKVKKGE